MSDAEKGFDWCAVRSSWRDRREAQRAAARLKTKKGKNVQAFRCADCQQWHIGREGHAPGSIKRRRPGWWGPQT